MRHGACMRTQDNIDMFVVLNNSLHVHDNDSSNSLPLFPKLFPQSTAQGPTTTQHHWGLVFHSFRSEYAVFMSAPRPKQNINSGCVW